MGRIGSTAKSNIAWLQGEFQEQLQDALGVPLEFSPLSNTHCLKGAIRGTAWEFSYERVEVKPGRWHHFLSMDCGESRQDTYVTGKAREPQDVMPLLLVQLGNCFTHRWHVVLAGDPKPRVTWGASLAEVEDVLSRLHLTMDRTLTHRSGLAMSPRGAAIPFHTWMAGYPGGPVGLVPEPWEPPFPCIHCTNPVGRIDF